MTYPLATRDAILAANDLKTEDVDVPEWQCAVRVSMLSGAARDSLSKAMVGADGNVDPTSYRERMVAACVVGEDGKALFSAEDVGALGAKSAVALQRVFAVAERLNAVTPATVEAAEKN
jgi:hypothetical protein